MIRIDELYCNTFWPWMQEKLPGTRMFYCDPPGHTKIHNLFNYGYDHNEKGYIFFHDQEPIHLGSFKDLFEAVLVRNDDLYDMEFGDPVGAEYHWELYINKLTKGSVIVSEQGDFVKLLEETYNWKSYYYFYHGWAALDWYRGYNRTFLISDYHSRKFTYSFISANRIVGGCRDHRILLMYHLLKQNIKNALISFPNVCPAEQQPVSKLCNNLSDRYTNIVVTLDSAGFPWNMPGEIDHPMHSCWLSLFEENAASLVHVVTETVYFGRKWHLTEKTFKPICLQMPFVLVSTAGSLEYLRSYGFKTFGECWDESYDLETDDYIRLEKIARLLKQFDCMTDRERRDLHQACWPVVKHNFDHFYGGGFEQLLWTEFSTMLEQIQQDFNQ